MACEWLLPTLRAAENLDDSGRLGRLRASSGLGDEALASFLLGTAGAATPALALAAENWQAAFIDWCTVFD